jgi:serine/threonine-protein phosphatase 2A regulatory subunit A
LKDEGAEVRLSLFKRGQKLSDLIDQDKMSNNIVPAMVALTNDKNWRVRLQVVELFPKFAKQIVNIVSNPIGRGFVQR